MVISNALVDLGMLPIQDIPQLSKSAHEVLMAAGLLLEGLREARASDGDHGTKLGPAIVPVASGYLPHHLLLLLSFVPWSGCNIHINIYI
jgi:hypothetical protein